MSDSYRCDDWRVDNNPAPQEQKPEGEEELQQATEQYLNAVEQSRQDNAPHPSSADVVRALKAQHKLDGLPCSYSIEELWRLAESVWGIEHLIPLPDDVSADDNAKALRTFYRALMKHR